MSCSLNKLDFDNLFSFLMSKCQFLFNWTEVSEFLSCVGDSLDFDSLSPARNFTISAISADNLNVDNVILAADPHEFILEANIARLIFIEDSDDTEGIITFHPGSIFILTDFNVEILVRLPNVIILNSNVQSPFGFLRAHRDHLLHWIVVGTLLRGVVFGAHEEHHFFVYFLCDSDGYVA